MTSTPRRSASIGALALLVLAIALPACGGGAKSSKGYTIKAPVLWAGAGADGKINSGVEDATVTAGDLEDPGFTVDLASVKAKDAGPQWLAASASAAAVATLLSSKDPSRLDLSYTITGQIDGPSGGAMLTVASLAAIRGLKLAEKTTMTGTISPDGSVGRVGEIPAKLRGAAKAGYKTVLLPMTNLTASGESSTSDMVEFGRTLGLDVQGVEDVATAFTAFTGETIYPPATPAPAPTPATTALVTKQATRLLDRIRTESTASTSASIIVQLGQASAALASGDVAKAYGLGVDTYTLLVRENAITNINSSFADQSPSGQLATLKEMSKALELFSSAAIETTSNITGLDPVAQLSLPFAMGWFTWADAILEGTSSALAAGSITPNSYGITAAALAEQQAAIEVFGPDAIEVVRSTPNPAVTTTTPPPEFLSGYTNFLVTAGSANLDYLSAVIGSKATTDSNGNPVFVALGMNALSATVEATPADTQPVNEEIQQASVAVTYFIFGTGLVSNTGANGIIGNGVGADTRSTVTLPGLINSVLLAESGVAALVDLLASRNLDPASARWSAQWGVAAANALNGSGRDAAGEYLALNELWYDAINCSVLYAATAPS
ncbi:unannotated protein [freshwater metagenome]|uniref:Unannotated protein n=1 Tax=freshwater metagenome TaxID=449393 RepID=A0A6J6EHB8_9ZZZZ